jgi:hypothetical protein
MRYSLAKNQPANAMQRLRSIIQLICIPFWGYRWLSVLGFSGLILVLLLVVVEFSFLYAVVTNGMPISILWELFSAFVQGDTIYPLGHFFLISILGGIYLTVIWCLVRRTKHVSPGSIITSMLGYVGISIGLSCIGCGAAYVVLLLSLFGASGSLLLVATAQPYLLVAGELILLVSIILAYRSLQRLQ